MTLRPFRPSKSGVETILEFFRAINYMSNDKNVSMCQSITSSTKKKLIIAEIGSALEEIDFRLLFDISKAKSYSA
jgi:hypothetical protein